MRFLLWKWILYRKIRVVRSWLTWFIEINISPFDRVAATCDVHTHDKRAVSYVWYSIRICLDNHTIETRWLHILDNTYYHYHYYDSYYNYYSIAIIIIVFGRVTTLKPKKRKEQLLSTYPTQSDHPIQALYLLILLIVNFYVLNFWDI